MATQPILAGTTLPHPIAQNGYSYVRAYRGARRIMADGTVVTDLIQSTARHEFILRWLALSSADLTSVRTAYDALKEASGTFLSPENVTYTVTLHPDSDELDISVRLVAGGALRYDVSLRLREA